MKLNKIILISMLLISCASRNEERLTKAKSFEKYAEQIREELGFYGKFQDLVAQEFAKLPWEFLLQKYPKYSPLIQSIEFSLQNEAAKKLGWVSLTFDEEKKLLLGTCITPVYHTANGRVIGYIKGKYQLKGTQEGFDALKKAYIVDADSKFVYDPMQVGARKDRRRHTLREMLPKTDGWRLSF